MSIDSFTRNPLRWLLIVAVGSAPAQRYVISTYAGGGATGVDAAPAMSGSLGRRRA